jgi:hypothetical protein
MGNHRLYPAIGWCLAQYGGEWATRPASPSRCASPCRSSLHRDGGALGLPPPSPSPSQPWRLGRRRSPRLLPPQGPTVAPPCAGGVARGAVEVRMLGHHGIEAVGNPLPLASGTTIALTGCHRLGGAGWASEVHMPQPCLLWRGGRQHRLASCLVRVPPARVLVAWRVAVGRVAQRFFLPRGAATPCAFSQPPDRTTTRRRAQRPPPSRDLAQRQVGPQDPGTHGSTGGALLPQGAKVRFQEWRRDGSRRASAPCVRMRPAAASSSSARSRRPGRMVCGSPATLRAIYSTPPCPRWAASPAA